jgi:small subunit ribosomal protein S17
MSETLTRTKRRVVTGVVTSDKMDKTIKVTVQRELKHAKYEKRVRRATVYAAHDEKNEAKDGDTVEIVESRRLSKSKTWRLAKVLRRAE